MSVSEMRSSIYSDADLLTVDAEIAVSCANARGPSAVATSQQIDRVFRFGPFELSEHEGELRKNGVRIKLQEQPFRVLLELAANAGHMVSREHLQQKLWPADTFGELDLGLNTAVRKLRQALGDDADEPRYIETLAKRGYRFIAPVANVAAAALTTSNDAPAVAAVAVLGNSADEASDAVAHVTLAMARKKRPKNTWWPRVLAAACALLVVFYGAFVTWRRANTTPPLAVEQRITANPPEAPITAAVVSLDGKYVAYADTTGVYIRHIDSGEVRPLQLPKGFDAVPAGWFPDGTHLLLSSGGATQGRPSLWKLSILGGSPQQLMENASEAAISPDGSKIAFLRGDAVGSLEIWVMGTDGNNLHRIADATGPGGAIPTAQPLTGIRLSAIAWSPDGRQLAYLGRLKEGARSTLLDDDRSLETVGVDGGRPKVLRISTQLLPALCWAVDGRLFYAYRDNPASERADSGIWWVRVNQKSGKLESKPVQLTKGLGLISGMSVSADGRRLILWRANSSPQVFLSEIDRETGRFKTPRRLSLDDSKNQVYAWTPDSRTVFFSSNRSGTTKLYRQAIDQAVPEVIVEGRGNFIARLNPDGTRILFVDGFNRLDPALPQRILSVPPEGGTPRVVLQSPSIQNIQCAWSPSRLCLFDAVEGSTAHFFTFDPEEGKPQEFGTLQVNGGLSWSLSRDGSQLALILQPLGHRITFMAVSDKITHDVEVNQWPLMNIDWAPDGKSVFISSRTADGVPVILSVEPNGNYRVLLEGDRAAQYWWVIPSPDGRHAALTEVTGANNVWVVENF
jgi:DNA-binding winged helix-turn-helix (wHTH) protein/Tol biopolymer transport system component